MHETIKSNHAWESYQIWDSEVVNTNKLYTQIILCQDIQDAYEISAYQTPKGQMDNANNKKNS
ncbi:hypothetical protein HKD37_20G056829 [Glycine soja]|nr:hypothetical protein GmHk_20G058206 [Glycine max]